MQNDRESLNTRFTRGVVCCGRLGTARTECISHERRSLCIGGSGRVNSEPKKKGHHEKSQVFSRHEQFALPDVDLNAAAWTGPSAFT